MTAILVETDTSPLINGVITDDLTGSPKDLTGAAVYFQMRLVTERRFRIVGACTIIGLPTAGTVQYLLQEDDLDFSGECLARFLVVDDQDRRQHTVPPLEITVQPQ